MAVAALAKPSSVDDYQDFDQWIHWTPRQWQAEDAYLQYRHTLYGGAAGGGKSYWLRWGPVRDLLRWHATYGLRGVRVGLFCESFVALQDRQLSRVRLEMPRWLGRYHDGTHELRLHPRYGAGVVCFRNLDDPSKYLSAEFAGLNFDEVTQAEEQQYDFMQTRLRWPGLPEEEYGTRSGTNPGGPGHGWVRRRWVDRQFLSHEVPDDYAFIPAFAADNPYLPAGYEDNLGHLPEELRKAYRDGSWDIFVGQVFGEFDRTVHVVPTAEIPLEWPRYRGLDYGYADPSAVLWAAQDPSTRAVWVYRELYGAGMDPGQLAERIRAQTGDKERIAFTVADPSIFAKNQQTKLSNADVLAANGVPPILGHNARIPGWRVVHGYLRLRDEMVGGQVVRRPRLYVVAEGCPNLVRTLPTLVYSQHNREDVDTTGDDHLADALRYLLMALGPLKEGLPIVKQPPSTAGRSLEAIREHAKLLGVGGQRRVGRLKGP